MPFALKLAIPAIPELKQLASTKRKSSDSSFYGDSDEWYGEQDFAEIVDSSAQQFSMATPRFSITSMATPREPLVPSAESPKPCFKPYWPYSSQWPFCRAPTTLELKCLPRGITANALILQLNAWGLADRCDYVHVTGRFAVINTQRHADGCELAAKLHGFTEWDDNKESKPCRVAWSFTRQGLHDLMANQNVEEAWREDGRYKGRGALLAWQALSC